MATETARKPVSQSRQFQNIEAAAQSVVSEEGKTRSRVSFKAPQMEKHQTEERRYLFLFLTLLHVFLFRISPPLPPLPPLPLGLSFSSSSSSSALLEEPKEVVIRDLVSALPTRQRKEKRVIEAKKILWRDTFGGFKKAWWG